MNDKTIPFFTASKPTVFRWPVRVPVPGDGVYSYVTFTGVFKYLDKAEVRHLVEESKLTDEQIVAQVLQGVEQLTYQDGTAVESTPELVAQVIAVDRVAPVALGTYLAALRGLAAEKNS